MGQDYLRAALPEPVSLAGLELHPFSLGHYLILERADSQYITGNPWEASIEELIFALVICSHTYEEGLALVRRPELFKKAKLRMPDPVAPLWGAFLEYFIQGISRPHYRALGDESGDSMPLFSPWQERLKVSLMTHLHFTESQVLNRPLSLCWWDYLTFEEMRGNVILLNEEEASFADQMQAQADEFDRAMRNRPCQIAQN